ncbi:MAG: hypothetical protein RH862_03090 [Leptospiraceae bacterium]
MKWTIRPALLIALLSFPTIHCISFLADAPDRYTGTLFVGGARGPALHPVSAPPYKVSDARFQEFSLEDLSEHQPGEEFKKHSVRIDATLYAWGTGEEVGEYTDGQTRVTLYTGRSVESEWDTGPDVQSRFQEETGAAPDLILEVDLSTVSMLPEGEFHPFVIQGLAGAVTLGLFPARSVTNRMNIQLKLQQGTGPVFCERSLAIDIWYRFSLLFGFVPHLWDSPSKYSMADNGTNPPFYSSKRINRIIGYMLDSCPAPPAQPLR